MAGNQSPLFTDWIAKGLPLIYTRQPGDMDEHVLQLAIPWFNHLTGTKQRFSCVIRQEDIHARCPLPLLSEVFPDQPLIPGYTVHVFGSYGWQYLTGEAYVQEQSDLDVLIVPEKRPLLRELSALLLQLKTNLNIQRLDAELRLPPLGDCSLFELLNSNAETVLFKSTHAVTLIPRETLYETSLG